MPLNEGDLERERQIGVKVGIYTVSQKTSPTYIFDCNLKINYQILIIFGANTPDTTCSNDHSVSHLTQHLFLHYLGKPQPAKYHFLSNAI